MSKTSANSCKLTPRTKFGSDASSKSNIVRVHAGFVYVAYIIILEHSERSRVKKRLLYVQFSGIFQQQMNFNSATVAAAI